MPSITLRSVNEGSRNQTSSVYVYIFGKRIDIENISDLVRCFTSWYIDLCPSILAIAGKNVSA